MKCEVKLFLKFLVNASYRLFKKAQKAKNTEGPPKHNPKKTKPVFNQENRLLSGL
jgi:hypothetical protein